MNEIEEARKEINEIDKQMALLYEKRMKAGRVIADYKRANALSVLDTNREHTVIEKNSSYVVDPIIKEYYVKFITEVMKESRDYQHRLNEGMKVAYTGVEGAFAYIASKKMFPNAKIIGYPDFTAAYKSVIDGECDTVVLPVENSTAGDVGIVMDLIFSGPLYISQMENVDIIQNLLAVKGATRQTIKTVYSHPQALAQCADYIKDNGYNQIEYINTAIAAKDVSLSNDKTIAAIASSETAKLYNLEIIDKAINSNRNNTTRFACFSRNRVDIPSNITSDARFILVFTVTNEAGSLAKALNIIGSNGFNMMNLRSRPMKGLSWSYYFFCELEGNVNTEAGRDLLIQLNTVCDRLKLVGTYTQSSNVSE